MIKKIFVVDDDPGILDALNMILDHEDYDVSLFSNGEEMLKKTQMLPDLILLDKQLPGIDGLDICRTLKNRSETSMIPVVILSASPHIANLAKLAGADETLEKPFRITALRQLVARYVGNDE